MTLSLVSWAKCRSLRVTICPTFSRLAMAQWKASWICGPVAPLARVASWSACASIRPATITLESRYRFILRSSPGRVRPCPSERPSRCPGPEWVRTKPESHGRGERKPPSVIDCGRSLHAWGSTHSSHHGHGPAAVGFSRVRPRRLLRRVPGVRAPGGHPLFEIRQPPAFADGSGEAGHAPGGGAWPFPPQAVNPGGPPSVGGLQDVGGVFHRAWAFPGRPPQ